MIMVPDPTGSMIQSIRTICQAEVLDANKQIGAASPQAMAGHGMKKNRNLYWIAGMLTIIGEIKGNAYLGKK